jgi:hypothetical protein
MRKRSSAAAFTLMELTIAAAVSAGVAIALGSFSLVAAKLAGRNMASNHGHSSIAIANQRLLRDVQASGSAIQLQTYDGTNFTDLTPTPSTDQDIMTGQTLSVRANAFRFWKVGGGPYKLTGPNPINPTTTALTFNFGPSVNGQLPYVPAVNDKLWFPLLDREFQITAVSTTPTPGSPSCTVTLHTAIGYTLDTTSPNVTTAMFFHQVWYYAYNNRLYYHDPALAALGAQYDPLTVHDMITSPKPFSVLFLTPTSPTSDRLTLRISLEAYDLNYSKPAYPNGATTMQTCISVRNQPPFVSLAQTPQ